MGYHCVWELSTSSKKETGSVRTVFLRHGTNNSPPRLILSYTAAEKVWSRICAKCYILYRKMEQICKILDAAEISNLCLSCSIRFNLIIPIKFRMTFKKSSGYFQSFFFYCEAERWLPPLLNLVDAICEHACVCVCVHVCTYTLTRTITYTCI